ncbi:MAG: hypothetical protein ACREVR_03460 [Burkholderiales bacterium]
MVIAVRPNGVVVVAPCRIARDGSGGRTAPDPCAARATSRRIALLRQAGTALPAAVSRRKIVAQLAAKTVSKKTSMSASESISKSLS